MDLKDIKFDEIQPRGSFTEKCGLCGSTHFRVEFENLCDGPVIEGFQTEVFKTKLFCVSCKHEKPVRILGGLIW